jgi:hypothetical protein
MPLGREVFHPIKVVEFDRSHVRAVKRGGRIADEHGFETMFFKQPGGSK